MFPYTRTARRRSVLVTTKTGKTFAGVLWARRGPLLILKRPQLLQGGGARVPLDGELVIDRANVDWLQILAPTIEEDA